MARLPVSPAPSNRSAEPGANELGTAILRAPDLASSAAGPHGARAGSDAPNAKPPRIGSSGSPNPGAERGLNAAPKAGSTATSESSASAPHVAWITGASRGIGKSLAVALCERFPGIGLLLVARGQGDLEATAAELRQHTTGSIGISPTDLTDPDAVSQVVAAAEAAGLGTPDLLINNAGIAPSESFLRTPDAVLRTCLTLHVEAPFRLAQAVLSGMRQRAKEGRFSSIIQLASTAGLRGYPFVTAYTAAKHGMIGFTRGLAAELRKTSSKDANADVRCWAMCPGFVDTDITRGAAADVASRGVHSAEEALAAMGKMNQIGRLHTADEVARATLALVTDRPRGTVYVLDQDPPGFVD